MSTMADEGPPRTGAARKARERRARANARHVCWLASCYQSLATHHTHPVVAKAGDEVKVLRDEIEQLKSEVAALNAAMRAKMQAAAEADEQSLVQDNSSETRAGAAPATEAPRTAAAESKGHAGLRSHTTETAKADKRSEASTANADVVQEGVHTRPAEAARTGVAVLDGGRSLEEKTPTENGTGWTVTEYTARRPDRSTARRAPSSENSALD